MTASRPTRPTPWPPALVGLAAVLFWVAAARYPGGYEWLHQSISSLFQPVTLSGAPNTARPAAIGAVLAFCLGIGMVFHSVARRGPTRFHQKTIQIAGIGSMVYAFLVVTPMHDVLVRVALAFFVIAMLATFHMLWREARPGMLVAGLVCISGTLWNAAIYQFEMGVGFLPAVQKVSTALWVGWLLVLYLSPAPEVTAGPMRADGS